MGRRYRSASGRVKKLYEPVVAPSVMEYVDLTRPKDSDYDINDMATEDQHHGIRGLFMSPNHAGHMIRSQGTRGNAASTADSHHAGRCSLGKPRHVRQTVVEVSSCSTGAERARRTPDLTLSGEETFLTTASNVSATSDTQGPKWEKLADETRLAMSENQTQLAKAEASQLQLGKGEANQSQLSKEAVEPKLNELQAGKAWYNKIGYNMAGFLRRILK